MDGIKPLFIDDISPAISLEQISSSSNTSEAKREQAAKDFESVFIHKLLEGMQKTVVDWSGEKDEASKQVQGIFWLYLSRDIAKNGGFGIWKDVQQFMTDTQKNGAVIEPPVGDSNK